MIIADKMYDLPELCYHFPSSSVSLGRAERSHAIKAEILTHRFGSITGCGGLADTKLIRLGHDHVIQLETVDDNHKDYNVRK